MKIFLLTVILLIVLFAEIVLMHDISQTSDVKTLTNANVEFRQASIVPKTSTANQQTKALESQAEVSNNGVCDERWITGDMVFTGQVIEILSAQKQSLTNSCTGETQNEFRLQKIVRFKIEKKYKGEKDAEQLVVETISGPRQPAFSFKTGESYLVYAHRSQHLKGQICQEDNPKVYPPSNKLGQFTQHISQAKQTIAFLESVSQQRNADDESFYEGIDKGTIVSGGIVGGKAISLVKPQYPEEAKVKKESGQIQVRVLIDEQGNIIRAIALCRQESALAKAAVDAALKSKFSPTRLSGKPVKVSGVIVYNFAKNE